MMCIIILYENVFQNPEIFLTQVSLSPKQSTLTINGMPHAMVQLIGPSSEQIVSRCDAR
jgi:hypothetical protein